MKNKIYIAAPIGLLLPLISLPAFAEETEPPTEEAAPVEVEYVPPPEAHEGPGGWSLIDPSTNEVKGGIVCTVDVCGPGGTFNGVMGKDYRGCENGCIIRFQSRASETGNVVGISSGVTWDGDSRGTYTITQTFPEGPVKKTTLVPSKTFADGQRFETGLVDITTRANVGDSQNYFRIDVVQENIDDLDDQTSILYLHNNQEKKMFSYFSRQDAANNFESDVTDYINNIESGSETFSDDSGGSNIVDIIKNIRDQIVLVFKYFFNVDKTIGGE